MLEADILWHFQMAMSVCVFLCSEGKYIINKQLKTYTKKNNLYLIYVTSEQIFKKKKISSKHIIRHNKNILKVGKYQIVQNQIKNV
jgi:hypothetical protein